MAQESGNTNLWARENGGENSREDLRIPWRVLEAAKWPEHELEEAWDLEKLHRKDSTGQTRPWADDWQASDDPAPGSWGWESVRGESISHPVAEHENGPGQRAVKLAGGIAAGMLLIAGFYAYHGASVSEPPRKPKMEFEAAGAQIDGAHADGTLADGILAADARDSHPPTRPVLPELANPSVAPADIVPPALAPSLDKATPAPRRTAQTRYRRIRQPSYLEPSYLDDDPINAPMTLTPENAPPPQRALPAVPR